MGDRLGGSALDYTVNCAVGFATLTGSQNNDTANFNVYTTNGTTLHLDTNESEAWTYFARADILLAAKSTFSHVPALLNPNCVIYQCYWHEPLKAWMVVDSGEEVDDASLKACIQRAKHAR